LLKKLLRSLGSLFGMGRESGGGMKFLQLRAAFCHGVFWR
jgi:hypothetical protein